MTEAATVGPARSTRTETPPHAKQAAARVWRDGQKKRVYIYRMLCAGSIEEKVFERQLSKEGLSGIATNEQVEPHVAAARATCCMHPPSRAATPPDCTCACSLCHVRGGSPRYVLHAPSIACGDTPSTCACSPCHVRGCSPDLVRIPPQPLLPAATT